MKKKTIKEKVIPVNALAVHQAVIKNMKKEQIVDDVDEIKIPWSLYNSLNEELVILRNQAYEVSQHTKVIPLPFKFECECGRSYIIGQ